MVLRIGFLMNLRDELALSTLLDVTDIFFQGGGGGERPLRPPLDPPLETKQRLKKTFSKKMILERIR